ncbi:PREDICTED: uncharacterized protein LOC109191479 [Ipomoea nil]|uniref:uncharacterized protein LOC109191479 n=1 Tax=Ipomoea nil TaxID=35883 RepID=UPI000901B4F6|nr:PREDICTED: uncharacterized protein LOC109191479 [Ipomoea nil]
MVSINEESGGKKWCRNAVKGIKIADVVRAVDFEFEEVLPHSQMVTITQESGRKKWCRNAANGADYVTPQPLIRRLMEEILIKEEILIIVMIWFIIIAYVVGALDFEFKEEAALPHPQMMSITKESGGKKWCRNAANGADYVTPQELMRRIMEEILMWEEILIIVMIWIFIILGIKIADVVRALDFEFEEALPHSQMMTITKESGGKKWCRNAANGADYVTPQELMRRIMEEILMWEEILIIVMIRIFIILGIKIADVVRALDFEFEEALPHSQMMTITKESGGKKWCRNAANGADYVTPQELMRRIMEEILMWEEILIIVMVRIFIILGIKIADVVRALDFEFEEALPHSQMMTITKESGGKKWCRNAANGADYVTPQELMRRIMEEILMWEEILIIVMIRIFIILGIKIADVVRALDFEFEEALPHSQMMTITKESGGKKWCRNAANGADYVTPQELMRRIMEEILIREEILIIVMIWFIIIVFIKIAVVVRALDFKFEEAALPHPQMVAITKESGGKKRCRNAANAANYVTPQQLRRIELKQ